MSTSKIWTVGLNRHHIHKLKVKEMEISAYLWGMGLGKDFTFTADRNYLAIKNQNNECIASTFNVLLKFLT